MVDANVQIVRSGAAWSLGTKSTEDSVYRAYLAAIADARYYIYIENQFFVTDTRDGCDGGQVKNQIGEAIFQRIMRAHRNHEKFRVYVMMPLLPAFEGEIGTASGVAMQAVSHWNSVSISKGAESLLGRLSRYIEDPSEYISFYGLRSWSKLVNGLTTELIYVHSKLLIIDDMRTIIGSSNINDRSMTGERDSEVCAIITDIEVEPGMMNGLRTQSGRFSGSLRRYLMREHLGQLGNTLHGDGNSLDVSDPVCDQFYDGVWRRIARDNTQVYEKVFGCIPSDTVRNFVDVSLRVKQRNGGEFLEKSDTELAEKQLESVQGHLVEYPHNFLVDQNLTPRTGTKEALVPAFVWQ